MRHAAIPAERIERSILVLRGHKVLLNARPLDEREVRIERKLCTHDEAIAGILDAIRVLMHSPEPTKKRRIGFVQND